MFYSEAYYVVSTVREDLCKSSSPISQLVLDKKIENSQVFELFRLKELADKGKLWVNAHDGHPKAMVRIYYSTYFSRWIATTFADGRQCNNLLTLPIYYGDRSSGGITYFEPCPLR